MSGKPASVVASGLEGVVAADTRLSSVDGEAGELIIAGFPVEELASRASFEETVYLLWRDALPDREQLAAFGEALAGWRALPAAALVARLPTIVAAYWRLLDGEEPVAPEGELGHAANYLYMLTGEEPGEEPVRALETYLNAVVDHGMNASTFAARVIVSTRSDVVSAIVGAIGALKGPL